MIQPPMHQNTVKNTEFLAQRQPIRPVNRNMAQAKLFHPRFGLHSQALKTLNRDNILRHTRQNGRCIARTGANFENTVMRLNVQKLQHPRHIKGRGHGLAAADGQGNVLARQIGISMRHKQFARHNLQCAQNIGVAQAFGAQF